MMNDSSDLEKAIANAQLEKLQMEIQGLKGRERLHHSVTPYLPIITVVIALGGFLFGIFQFQAQQRQQQNRTIDEQRKDRATKEAEQLIRIQDQIRKDVDELLQFTNDKRQTVSRAGFLLQNLKYQLAYRIGENQKVSDIYPDQARNITKSLVQLIMDDCNFVEGQRDTAFAFTVVQGWEDYSSYLRQAKDELDYILDKLTTALKVHHDNHPKYFEELDYNPENGDYIVTFPMKGEESFLPPYINLEEAFRRHLEIAEQGSELRAKYIRLFQSVLCNKKLTQHTFKASFEDLGKCSR